MKKLWVLLLGIFLLPSCCKDADYCEEILIGNYCFILGSNRAYSEFFNFVIEDPETNELIDGIISFHWLQGYRYCLDVSMDPESKTKVIRIKYSIGYEGYISNFTEFMDTVKLCETKEKIIL